MSILFNLFSPIEIGSITIKNRLVMPAMSVNFGVDANGFVNDQLTEYFVARAKSGTGMLVVGGGGIDPLGHELPQLPALWDSNCIPRLAKMTRRVKSFGARFGMQIMHGGRQTYNATKEAPSAIAAPAVVKGVPEKLTIKRIRQLVNAFGDSARYCKDAGFDFVEIHAAHGYLINQFLSPNANYRNDEYGGSYHNRIRFLLEVLENIKIKTMYKFPVGIRLNGEDYIDNGWCIDDAVKLASILEEQGADYLHVSAGVYGSSQLTIPSMYVEEGCFLHLATAVKENVSIPVIAVGRVRDLEFADKQIREDKADMFAMGRSHLADPEIAEKAISGNLANIRPCIGCCVGCIDRVLSLEEATCVVNPKVGKEYLLRAEPTISKKILVIGAGLSGLNVACEAVHLGHQVIIVEKAGYIGGAAKFAAVPPGRSNIMEIIAFLENELNKHNVEIRINVDFNKNLIDTIMPEQIIIATGAFHEFPLIKGLSQTAMNLYNPLDILTKKAVVGNKAIILGGNSIGLLLADYLSEKGKEITVLHRGKHFAEGMARNDRFYLRERLKKSRVKLFKEVSLVEVLDKGVIFKYRKNLKHLLGHKDFIISEKLFSNRVVHRLIEDFTGKVHIVGDARSPGDIMHSIDSGEQIGISI